MMLFNKSNKSNKVIVYLALGANVGDARANVNWAIARIQQLPQTQLLQSSSLFLTEPIESSGDDYINAVVEIETQLSALDLLHACQEIEQACGRERPYHNAPRTLDIDVLLYGDELIHTTDLIVPHPRMTERAFVLIPLLQINPFIHIPQKGMAHEFVTQVAHQSIQKIN